MPTDTPPPEMTLERALARITQLEVLLTLALKLDKQDWLDQSTAWKTFETAAREALAERGTDQT